MIVCSPYTSILVNKIETVQLQAAQFICNNYCRRSSVSEMLKDLNLPTLEARREYNQIVMMFKIVNKLVSIPVESPIVTLNSMPTRGHNQRFQLEPIFIRIHFFQIHSNYGTISQNLLLTVMI